MLFPNKQFADGSQLLMHGLIGLNAHGDDAVRSFMGNGGDHGKACQNSAIRTATAGGPRDHNPPLQTMPVVKI